MVNLVVEGRPLERKRRWVEPSPKVPPVPIVKGWKGISGVNVFPQHATLLNKETTKLPMRNLNAIEVRSPRTTTTKIREGKAIVHADGDFVCMEKKIRLYDFYLVCKAKKDLSLIERSWLRGLE